MSQESARIASIFFMFVGELDEPMIVMSFAITPTVRPFHLSEPGDLAVRGGFFGHAGHGRVRQKPDFLERAGVEEVLDPFPDVQFPFGLSSFELFPTAHAEIMSFFLFKNFQFVFVAHAPPDQIYFP